MQIYRTISDLMQALKIARESGLSIGLVPTMGNLHDGHLALVKKAKTQCDFILATIFINPTQFGPEEDIQNYPRSFENDTTVLNALNCDAVFAPNVEEIYPQGTELETSVTVHDLSKLHCGASRPGHFDGVCTIVTKLFNICQPDKAYFGKKDYQQLTIIKKLVNDLNFPLEIIAIPTQREESGLALSSRNSYLNTEQKKQAGILYKSLKQTKDSLKKSSIIDYAKLEKSAIDLITSAGLRVDYFSICHAKTLLPAKQNDTELVIVTAAYLGETRLIDNLSVSL